MDGASTQWRPQEQGLKQILQLIEASRTADNNRHRQIVQELSKIEQSPEFNGYLCFIFAGDGKNNRPSFPTDSRHRAGLLLRTNVKKHFNKCPAPIRQFMKAALLSTAGDPAREIRLTLGSIIATVLTETLEKGKDIWPNIFVQVAQAMKESGGSSDEVIDSSLNILCKACSDLSDSLMEWGSLIDPVVPLVLALHGHHNPSFRAQSLDVTHQMLYYPPPAFRSSLNQAIQKIFHLTQDDDRRVRKFVIRCLIALLERHMEQMLPHMEDIIKFHIRCSMDEDEEICLEGTEFWNTYSKQMGTDKTVLARFLPELVPVLLKNMRFSAMQIAEFDMHNDDTAIADKAESLKPAHHKSKWEDGGDSDDEAAGSADTEWNVRKCSARALDNLSNVYGDSLLAVLLVEIEKVLKSEEWPVRESGILALGAISRGCGRGIEQYLHNLVPFLFRLMDDQQVLIRSMACWSSARYSYWMLNVDGDNKKFVEPFLKKLMERIVDNSKKVQDAACAALSAFVESGQDRLKDYAEGIVGQVHEAFKKYKLRNMPVLYDVAITLTDNITSLSQRPELMQKLVEPVMKHFCACDDDDQRIFSIMDTLMTFAVRMGHHFAHYAGHIIQRALKISNTVLKEVDSIKITTRELQKEVKQRMEFLICSLDVLSSMCEGIGAPIQSALQGSNLLDIIMRAIKDKNPHVQRSGFALLGDLFHAVPKMVSQPNVAEGFIRCAIDNLNHYSTGVCVNALWTVGEATAVFQEKMQPYCKEIVRHVSAIITAPDQLTERRVKDNSAIILARLSYYLPQEIVKWVDNFKRDWILILMHYPEDSEKARAFLGLLKVIEANPAVVCKNVADVAEVVTACCAWRSPPHQLEDLFKQLLNSFVNCLGQEWKSVCSKLPPEIISKLNSYNLPT